MRVNLRIFVYSYPLCTLGCFNCLCLFFCGFLFVCLLCVSEVLCESVCGDAAVSEPCICGTMKDQPASMSSLVRDAHVLGTSQAKACFV